MAGYAGAAVAGALLLLLGVNQIDEELTPEARAYYESGKTPELTEASGFALIVGFSAPVDQDPRRYAVEWSKAVAAAGRDKKRYPLPQNILSVRAGTEVLCRPEEFDCPERFSAKPQSIADLVADHSVLLRRYRDLQSQTDLADAGIWAAYDAPFFDYSTVILTQGVFLSQVAITAAAGDLDRALDALEADAAFYRKWLSESRLVIAKMIAVRGLSRDLLLATQIARRTQKPTADQRSSFKRIAAPLSRAEFAFRNAIRSEAAFLPLAIDRAREGRKERQEFVAQENPLAAQLLGLSILRNASLNYAYRFYSLSEQLDAVESKDLPARVLEIHRVTRSLEEPQWSWAYNLGGKAVVAKAWPDEDFDPYIYRIRDVDALAKLACAMFAIREHGVAPEAVEAHLAKPESACRDPYTGQPFRWDAAAKALWFEPKGPGSGVRFGGTKERVALSPY